METGSMLIGAISIIVIVIPFILMYRKAKSTERGLVKGIKTYAEKNGLQLDKYEAVANLALGLDHKNKVAYFSEVECGVYDTRHVFLPDVSTCKINREVRVVDYHGEKDKITHRLEMCFYPKNKKDEVTTFLLFDEDTNHRLSGEIQLANEWAAHFNSVL